MEKRVAMSRSAPSPDPDAARAAEPGSAVRRLGELLVEARAVNPELVDQAVRAESRALMPRRLGDLLVEVGAVAPRALADAVAAQHQLPSVDPFQELVDPVLTWRVPADLARRAGLLVLRGPRLLVGDPDQVKPIHWVKALLGAPDLPLVVADPQSVAQLVERHYDTSAAQARQLTGVPLHERPPVLSPTGLELDVPTLLGRLRSAGRHALEDVCTALLVHSVEWGADQVELEGPALTYFAEGVPTPILELPRPLAPLMHAHLRERLGMAARALAQPASTRTDLALGDHVFHVRASARPGSAGGCITLELAPVELGAPPGLSMTPRVALSWHQATAGAGLILLVGPPSAPLRQLVASAPDAIYAPLVDGRMLAAAVDAALDGATVLGHVSAPDLPRALARLSELTDAPRFASALTAMVAFRSLRRVCSTCQLPPEQDASAVARFGVFAFAAPRVGPGCPHCRYRGYSGSLSVFELAENDPDLSAAIAERAAPAELAAALAPIAGRSLQVDGVAQAIARRTTTAELKRVLPATPRPPVRGHEGLLRALTDPPVDEEPFEDLPTDVCPPIVLVAHPDLALRATLRARYGARAAFRFVGSVGALDRALERRTPALAILASELPGAWNAPRVRRLHDAGVRVWLLRRPRAATSPFAPPGAEVTDSVDELIEKLGRWLPEE